jgi:hypothetical protein
MYTSQMPLRRTALFNRKGDHRKRLTREWGLVGTPEPRAITFVMLNPSTGNATEDDPTIRRCIGFAMREGFQGLHIVNLFTLRSTDPSGLLERPHKSLNTYDADMQIATAAMASDKIVAAWGAVRKPLDYRIPEVLHVLREAKKNVWCLGKTNDGSPKHPLLPPQERSSHSVRVLWP